MDGDEPNSKSESNEKVTLVPNLFLNEPVYEEYDDENTPFHYLAKNDKQKYKDNKITTIRVVYLISVVLWLVILYVFRFFETDLIGIVILIFPIIIFSISFSFIEFNTVDVESEMLGGNVLSFVFLVVTIMIKWSEIKQKRKILLAIIVSIVLLMGSLVDVWVNKENIIIIKHIRSIFNTTALSLLIYALYTHYSDMLHSDEE